MSQYDMTGPAGHENAALNAVANGNVADGQVFAILALAAAVNRLAEAHEDIARADAD